jgi:hypothetical protein
MQVGGFCNRGVARRLLRGLLAACLAIRCAETATASNILTRFYYTDSDGRCRLRFQSTPPVCEQECWEFDHPQEPG